MKFYAHPQTQRQLEGLASRQPHAILLGGQRGSGKTAAAQHIAQSLKISPGNTQLFTQEKSSLGIDFARQLQALYKLKNADSELRAVIVEDVDSVSREAQNALLKLIEEPPQGVVFILTASAPQSVLSTIRSRCVQATILPLLPQQTAEIIQAMASKSADAHRLTIAAENKAGELMQLLTDEAYQKQRLEQLALAKDCVSAARYDRIALLRTAPRKDEALVLLGDMLLILQLAMRSGSQKQAVAQSVASNMQLVLDAISYIQQNAQVKLQLDYVSAHWQ